MDSRKEFIKQNIGLVHACAKRFKGRGIEYDDLVQAGCIGLIKSADGFDKNRGIKFSTYAVPAILGEMKRLFRDDGTIKISRSLKELSLKAGRAIEDFFKKEGYEPSISELAKILNIDKETASQALMARAVPLSLTACDDDNNQPQIDIPTEAPDEKLSENLALKQIVKQLEEKDRAIITLRFFKSQTQTQTAKILGMTQVQVSRREKVILKNLREKLIC